MYLGLTGTRVKWGDALWSGLATHPVKAENLLPLLEMITMNGDPEGALRNFFTMPRRETEQANWKKIDGWFGAPSLDGIVKSLEAAKDDELAASILATLRAKSPTSLRVTFRTINTGITKSVDDCMRMEFRVVNRMLAGHDFYEGIRAIIVDKDNAPKWHPAHLSDVPEKAVDHYFAPLPHGDLRL
jgi:enoyl-CoA hydratase